MYSLPEAGEGELRWGSLRIAARGPMPAGRLSFAVLMSSGPAAAKASPWRLYVDRDLDGDLSEERPVVATPQTEEMDAGGRKVSASGARFPVVMTGLPGGGKHAYVFTAYRSAGQSMVDVRSAMALSASVDILGQERAVVIYDSNVNARFGDLYRAPLLPADDIGVDTDGDGRIGRGEVRPLARRVYHEGRAVAVSVSSDASTLAVKPLDVRTGAIVRAGAAAEGDVLVQLSSTEYGLLPPLAASAGPEGEHRLVAYGITRKGEGGGEGGGESDDERALSGQWLMRPGPLVDVPPGGTVEVGFGPPLAARAALAFIQGGRRAIVKVVFAGSAREDATVLARAGPRLGTWRVVDAGGGEHGSGKLFPGPLPGLWVGEWKVPSGLERGRKLVFEVVPDLGPFSEGFEGRTPFEYGVSTPVTLVVIGVDKGSQAGTLGVEPGDEIVSYDGKEIRNEIDMSLAVSEAMKRSGTVEFVINRGGELRRFDARPGQLGVNVSLVMPLE